jgi:hypothetical protein
MTTQDLIMKDPNHTEVADRIYRLLNMAYDHYSQDHNITEEEFILYCIDKYNGTLAGSLVDYIYNHFK